MITAGNLPVGTRLPPQRDLAKLFNVNRSTVVAAMEELAALGVVEGRGSAGTVIADDTWSLLLPGRGTWRERITAGALQASTSIVQAINIHEFDEGVIRLGPQRSILVSSRMTPGGMPSSTPLMIPSPSGISNRWDPRNCAQSWPNVLCGAASALARQRY